MTLVDFKRSLKFILVIIFLMGYGLGFYLLGRNSNLAKTLSVKGVATDQTLASPLESPVPFADTQSATITSSYVKLCANTVHGFELSYPKDWFTTYNTEQEKCNFFAPYSFIVPYDTTNFLIPIRLEVIKPEDWLGNVKFYENPNDFHNVISAENIEVDGKSVKLIELTATAQDAQRRGFVKTVYLIFDSEYPIVLTYQQTDANENIETAKKVLEEMVSSIRYF